MKNNPIRKKFLGTWAWVLSRHAIVGRRSWIAVCPECNQEITHKDYRTSATRKNTKDALHRHIKVDHKPGLVGH